MPEKAKHGSSHVMDSALTAGTSWPMRCASMHGRTTLVRQGATPLGERFVVEGPMAMADGTVAPVRSVWFVESGAQHPALRYGISFAAKMKNMIEELDDIVLTRDLPEQGLRAGDIGTVVLVHRNNAGYEVEFTSLDGDTIAVLTLTGGPGPASKSGGNCSRAIAGGSVIGFRALLV